MDGRFHCVAKLRQLPLFAVLLLSCLVPMTTATARCYSPAAISSPERQLREEEALTAKTAYTGAFDPGQKVQIGLLRWYDPNLQRWLNRDPIGERGGINLYTAVGNDPVNSVDPFGWSSFNDPPDISFTVGTLPPPPIFFTPSGSFDENRTPPEFIPGVSEEPLGYLLLPGGGLFLTPSAGAGVCAMSARRFLYDPRRFRQISKQYWATRGPAAGRSLHHWLFPQEATWVPEGIRNAGFNLVELPPLQGTFHPTLGLNQWMGFAQNWGPEAAAQAQMVQTAIRLGIPTLGAGSAVGGYYVGKTLTGN